MISELANGLLVLALIGCLYGITAVIASLKRNSLAWADSARITLLVNFGLVSASFLLLISQILLERNFQKLIYESINPDMPLLIRLVSVTNQSAGAMFVWIWLISLMGLFLGLQNWRGARDKQSWVIGFYLANFLIHLIILILIERPFVRMWLEQTDGVKLAVSQPLGYRLVCPLAGIGNMPDNFCWLSWAQVPLIFLSAALMTVSYAMALTSLFTGQASETDLERSHPFSFLAWLVLVIVILVELMRVYTTQPGNGFWNWSLFQTVLMIPLLLLSALIHSLTVHRSRSLFRHLSITLMVCSYFGVMALLVLKGFPQDNHIGKMWLITSLTAAGIISLGLLVWRQKELSSNEKIESPASREVMVLLGILLMSGLAVICLWGAAGPIVVPKLTGITFSFGVDQHNEAMAGPITAILLIMGSAPFSAWGYSNFLNVAYGVWRPLAGSLLVISLITILGVHYQPAILGLWLVAFGLGATIYGLWRKITATGISKKIGKKDAFKKVIKKNYNRYAGYLIHIGVLLLAISVIGVEMLTKEVQGRLRSGESLRMSQYEIVFLGASSQSLGDGQQVVTAEVEIRENERSVGRVYPKVRYYPDSSHSSTLARSTWFSHGLNVMLADWVPATSESAVLKVYISPLIGWYWLGVAVIFFGAILRIYGMYNARRNKTTYDQDLAGHGVTMEISGKSE